MGKKMSRMGSYLDSETRLLLVIKLISHDKFFLSGCQGTVPEVESWVNS